MRCNEQMRQHLINLTATHGVLDEQLQDAKKKASAATEQVAAMEKQLSDKQVSGSCG
jgi:hypothetical protein